MKITSQDFEHGQWIPSECAYGQLVDGQFALAENLNPQLSWSGLPKGTQSVVLACIDPDVPTDRKALNEEGEIPADQPRRDFVHWLVWDMDPAVCEVKKGEASVGDEKSGKRFAKPMGIEAINDYPVLRDSMLVFTVMNSECMRLMSKHWTCPIRLVGRKFANVWLRMFWPAQRSKEFIV